VPTTKKPAAPIHLSPAVSQRPAEQDSFVLIVNRQLYRNASLKPAILESRRLKFLDEMVDSIARAVGSERVPATVPLALLLNREVSCHPHIKGALRF
jgi:hypothetical protein